MDLGMVLGQASELVLSSVRIPGRFKIDVSTVQGFGLGFAHCHVPVFASSSSSSWVLGEAVPKGPKDPIIRYLGLGYCSSYVAQYLGEYMIMRYLDP